MENLNLSARILMEMKDLIVVSCHQPKGNQRSEALHIALLKKHYNAATVSIDYHRGRVEMDMVVDDGQYDSKTINIDITTLYANLWFRDLQDFLMSCVAADMKSIAFYAQLIHTFKQEDRQLLIA